MTVSAMSLRGRKCGGAEGREQPKDTEVKRVNEGGSGTTSDEVAWNNGWRTSDGKFASPQGNQKAGAWAEQDAWDSIKQEEDWEVVQGRIFTKDCTGQIRVYDEVAVTPSGKNIGVEVKSE